MLQLRDFVSGSLLRRHRLIDLLVLRRDLDELLILTSNLELDDLDFTPDLRPSSEALLPVLDSCHHQIVRALRQDGWTIADKPKYIDDPDSETFVYIDIEAFRDPNGSPSEARTIYVEVKCFPRKNVTQEIYIALGQYLIYRALLDKQAIAVPLYLAVPQTVYEATFNAVFRKALHDSGIMMMVVDLVTETIVQWIK